ncbi:MAG: glycosyltransferase family 2 protein [Candidatus Omnitrophica bacterium]|nr:glycosyltransferase family 2 protein [Candidatus Omnitrophota bacterium]
MTTKDGISIVLPAYNEEANIAHAINDVLKYFSDKSIEYEIIVVNDGSRDKTRDIVKSFRDSRIRLIDHETNQGYGRSLRDGFKAGRYEYLFFTDADRQFDITGLDVMLPIIRTDTVDLLIGYRIDRQDPFLRRFLSWGFNSLVGFIFDLNVKDIDCAFKVFRRHVFDKIEVRSKDFFVNTEILVKANFYGFRIVEVGVPHFPRQAGKSTVSFKYIPRTLRELTRIWLEMRELKKVKSQK